VGGLRACRWLARLRVRRAVRAAARVQAAFRARRCWRAFCCVRAACVAVQARGRGARARRTQARAARATLAAARRHLCGLWAIVDAPLARRRSDLPLHWPLKRHYPPSQSMRVELGCNLRSLRCSVEVLMHYFKRALSSFDLSRTRVCCCPALFSASSAAAPIGASASLASKLKCAASGYCSATAHRGGLGAVPPQGRLWSLLRLTWRRRRSPCCPASPPQATRPPRRTLRSPPRAALGAEAAGASAAGRTDLLLCGRPKPSWSKAEAASFNGAAVWSSRAWAWQPPITQKYSNIGLAYTLPLNYHLALKA
jgi:hypothetical protein